MNTCTQLWTRRPVCDSPCLHRWLLFPQPQHLSACCAAQIGRLRNRQVGHYNNVHVASFLPESNHTLPHLKYNYVMGDVSACGGGGGRWAGTTWTKEDRTRFARKRRRRVRGRGPGRRARTSSPIVSITEQPRGGNGLARVALQPTKEC